MVLECTAIDEVGKTITDLDSDGLASTQPQSLATWSCVAVDHIHFYVDDVCAWGEHLHRAWGFQPKGYRHTVDSLSLWLQQEEIVFVLSQAVDDRGPVAHYLRHHPQGVADVAFKVHNLESLRTHLERLGCPGIEIVFPRWDGPAKSSSKPQFGYRVQTPFGLQHTLLNRSPHSSSETLPLSWKPILPGFRPITENSSHWMTVLLRGESVPRFTSIDHVVLNVGAQQLQEAVNWYQTHLGLESLYSFNIQTPNSGLHSIVLGHQDTGLQFPINEPSDGRSQIQEFITANQGCGIQHIALHTQDIVNTVAGLRHQGVDFLEIPAHYYKTLPQDPRIRSMGTDLQDNHLLLDLETSEQWLLQTFTQPLFPEPTLFFEIIERRHRPTGFGEGNFKALFEAVEREQQRRADPPSTVIPV